jgi:hypothetical protein
MSIHTDVLAYLSTQSGITDLIGAKLYPHRASQAGSTQSGRSTPYVTYQAITDEHETILTAAAGHADLRIQLTAWSTSYGTAWSIAEAMRQELQGMGNTTVGTTSYVYSVRHGGSVDMPTPPEDFSDAGHYGVASDYLILYRSAIPTF